MMDNNDDIRKALKELRTRLEKDMPRPQWDTIIQSSKRPLIDTGKMREGWKGNPVEDTQGFKVYSSDFVPAGKAYLIDTSRLKFDLKPELSSSVELQASINLEIALAFGIDWRFGYREPKPYHWQRWQGERFMDWSNRLFQRGLLDDPDIRWTYQKALFVSVVEWARKLVKR